MFHDIDTRISRYLEFYRKEEPALLIHVRCVNRCGSSEKVHYLKRLWDFDFKKKQDREKWFDALYDEVIQENKLHPLADDYLPSGKIVWGPIFSILIKDRPIQVQQHSSWINHCLQDLKEINSLEFKLDENNFWWQLYKEAKTYLVEKLGEFVTPVYHQGVLDLAWDLRGNDLYTDFYTDPEDTMKLIDFCTDALIRIGDAAREIRPANARTDYWVPGWGFNVLVPGYGGITTCDTSCQISPELFKEFEVPYMEKIQKHAPGYLLHSHSVGKQQQSIYAGLKGINIIQLVTDPNATEPTEDMENIIERIGMKPVIITTTAENVYKNINALKKGRVVLRVDAANEGEASEILSFVRRNSRISD